MYNECDNIKQWVISHASRSQQQRMYREEETSKVRGSGPRPQLIFRSSTSNLSVEFGGITGGNPRAPYACIAINTRGVRSKGGALT